MKRAMRGRSLGTVIATMSCVLTMSAAFQSISELESRVDRFRSDAKELYRFDEGALDTIWQAYCGKLDPNTEEWGPRFAAEIGQTLQNQESDKVRRLSDDIRSLTESARRLKENANDRDRAAKALDELQQ